MRFPWVLSGAAILAVWAMVAQAGELAAPVQVMADGKPLDVGGIGYAAPFMGERVKLCATDFNGDGRLDLLPGDRSGEVVQRELTEE